jgi:hypothetical protein
LKLTIVLLVLSDSLSGEMSVNSFALFIRYQLKTRIQERGHWASSCATMIGTVLWFWIAIDGYG